MISISHNTSFTLIELLIVVAIIAILALIAVPNFLEAQVRSKVSRVKADMRTVGTALELYMVDFNHYPPSFDWPIGDDAQARLTTPIAYITSLPHDPFNCGQLLWPRMTDPPAGAWFGDALLLRGIYGYMSYPEILNPQDFKDDFESWTGREWTHSRGWELRSFGPDREDSWGTPYDPTNGTVSFGDIAKFGPGFE